MQYRPDIDGLRALAVIPIVFFHAGFSSLSGGFIGVDIFFVISGYLITTILLKDIETEQFSIIHFYERRARRILPALFFVLFFTCIGTYLLYFPTELKSFINSLFSTLFFSSNILFWIENGNYFDTNSHTKPLLHTWSLSVEEQFYIFFPLLLIILSQFTQKILHLVLFLSVIFSLALSIYGVFNIPKATFYLLPTRAWELLLGAIIATGFIRLPSSQKLRESLSFIGFFLIIFSLFYLSEQQPFPGYNALYPCIGTVLIILAGQNNNSTLITRLLSFRAIVFIGLISYSLYLWHWPIMVFTTTILGEISLLIQWSMVFASIAAATFSWRYIERPFRGRKSRFSSKNIFYYSLTGYIIFILIALYTLYMDGLPNRFSHEIQRITHAKHTKSQLHLACKEGKGLSFASPCIYGDQSTPPTIALWGDSHSRTLPSMLHNIAISQQKSILHYSFDGCLPLIGIQRHGKHGPACGAYNQKAFDLLLNNDDINTIILFGRWSSYVKGSAWDAGPAESKEHLPYSQDEREAQFRKSVTSTLEALINAEKHVILVYPTPETGHNIPITLARNLMLHNQSPADFTSSYAYFNKRQDIVLDAFDNISYPNLTKIYPHKELCTQQDCIVYENNEVLYFDDDHLSLHGAERLRTHFEKALQQK